MAPPQGDIATIKWNLSPHGIILRDCRDARGRVRVEIPLSPHHGLDAAVCRSKCVSDREDLALRRVPAALEPHR